ncbi:hypothetical protein J7I98_07240 [Streptomyces sp. ISL-98]|uniref:hypothetical protein n=1 Tax=Streptomyces sp. ISL-98 TaxID=2819192 RepID=UPI001BE6B9A5|nr:hypothetical protein [Streptomyces sp. ISL-98]MBT2505700.1 hypothetical protein [Streptomyces sp. ISL-98]
MATSTSPLEAGATALPKNGQKRTITITVPSFPLPSAGRVASGAANAVLLPFAVARRVLPAKGGLPLYLGLGALGAADIIDWPVAIGIGVGYAVLRPGSTDTGKGPGTGPSKEERGDVS